MSIFWKSREERDRERQELEAKVLSEQDRLYHQVAAAWGAQGSDLSRLCREIIVPFTTSDEREWLQTQLRHSARQLGILIPKAPIAPLPIPDNSRLLQFFEPGRFNLEVLRLRPTFGRIVLGAIAGAQLAKLNFGWASCGKFTYPACFEPYGSLAEAAAHSPELAVLWAVRLLSPADKEQAKARVLQEMEQAKHLGWAYLTCREFGWLNDLDATLRRRQLFVDLVILLAARTDWDGLLVWLSQHAKHFECVLVLEQARRYTEAADLLERLGPANVVRYNDQGQLMPLSLESVQPMYDLQLAKLRGLAEANRSPAPPKEISLIELQSRYDYGEITKEEHENVKETLAQPAFAACAACSQVLASDFDFCPYCGARLTAPAKRPPVPPLADTNPPVLGPKPPVHRQEDPLIRIPCDTKNKPPVV